MKKEYEDLTKRGNQHILTQEYGLVAQLGAHHIRIVGVESSNLFKSTKNRQLSTESCRFYLLPLHYSLFTKNQCVDFWKVISNSE